jgi:hypothetical protein
VPRDLSFIADDGFAKILEVWRPSGGAGYVHTLARATAGDVREAILISCKETRRT